MNLFKKSNNPNITSYKRLKAANNKLVFLRPQKAAIDAKGMIPKGFFPFVF